jgi:hypothetical protein
LVWAKAEARQLTHSLRERLGERPQNRFDVLH